MHRQKTGKLFDMLINQQKLCEYSLEAKPCNWQDANLMLPQNSEENDAEDMEEEVVAELHKNDFTQFHLACHSGNVEKIRLLLETVELEGLINKSICNYHGEVAVTPLCCAVYSGNSEVVQLLVNSGAEMTRGSGPLNLNPLHIAAGLDSGEACLQILLKAGADPKAKNGRAETALHFAAANHQIKNVMALLNAGVDGNSRDMDGRTPLHCAVVNEGKMKVDTVQLLLSSGRVDINAQDDEGYTALHLSAMNENRKVAALLVRSGSDVTLK